MPTRQVVTQRLLARLLLAQGGVVPDGVLMAAIWGDDLPVDPAVTLAQLVSRLRRRLPHPGAIERLRGVGYRLDPAAAPDLPAVDARLLVPAPPRRG